MTTRPSTSLEVLKSPTTTAFELTENLAAVRGGGLSRRRRREHRDNRRCKNAAAKQAIGQRMTH